MQMTRTIGHRWPTSAPRGDYPAECAYCGTVWRRSQLRVDGTGQLVCPQEGPGRDRVTLDRLNAQRARRTWPAPRTSEGTYRKQSPLTAQAGWSAFDIASDTTGPELAGLIPANGATLVRQGQDLIMSFNEAMAKGTGFISVCDSGDTCGLYNVATSAVVVDGPNVIIPITSYTLGETYYVLVPSTALTDVAGNPWAGIDDQNTWRFTIEPANNATLAFNVPGQTQTAGVESAATASVAFAVPGQTETATVESSCEASVAFNVPGQTQTATVSAGTDVTLAFNVPGQTQTATTDVDVDASVAFNVPGQTQTATTDVDVGASVAFAVPGQTQTATTDVDVGASVAFAVPGQTQTATVEMELLPAGIVGFETFDLPASDSSPSFSCTVPSGATGCLVAMVDPDGVIDGTPTLGGVSASDFPHHENGTGLRLKCIVWDSTAMSAVGTGSKTLTMTFFTEEFSLDGGAVIVVYVDGSIDATLEEGANGTTGQPAVDAVIAEGGKILAAWASTEVDTFSSTETEIIAQRQGPDSGLSMNIGVGIRTEASAGTYSVDVSSGCTGNWAAFATLFDDDG